MKVIKQSSIFNICFLFILILIPQQANSQDERGNEYRITVFPSHKITEKITGFAYLGYVWNPEKNYQTYYFGYPAGCYSFKPWLQVWGGLVGLYTNNESTSDKLELRPFVGPKIFLPNELKWNIYNFTRYEYRATHDSETKDWNNYSRLRSRFGIEFPLSSLENAWQPGKFYGLADVEPYYRFDKGQFDPVRIRSGVGYIFKKAPLRVEFIYHMQFTHPDAATGLRFTDNIYRINFKLGLNKGIINKLDNPDID